jgi:N-hydroxyarylamine O-acetyltransferase
MNQGVNVIRNGIAKARRLPDRKALRSPVTQHLGFDLPELETMPVEGVPGCQ